MSHCLQLFALSMVSAVVKVLELTSMSVSSGFRPTSRKLYLRLLGRDLSDPHWLKILFFSRGTDACTRGEIEVPSRQIKLRGSCLRFRWQWDLLVSYQLLQSTSQISRFKRMLWCYSGLSAHCRGSILFLVWRYRAGWWREEPWGRYGELLCSQWSWCVTSYRMFYPIEESLYSIFKLCLLDKVLEMLGYDLIIYFFMGIIEDEILELGSQKGVSLLISE